MFDCQYFLYVNVLLFVEAFFVGIQYSWVSACGQNGSGCNAGQVVYLCSFNYYCRLLYSLMIIVMMTLLLKRERGVNISYKRWKEVLWHFCCYWVQIAILNFCKVRFFFQQKMFSELFFSSFFHINWACKAFTGCIKLSCF